MPLKAVEDICVFYQELPTYNPIMGEGPARKRTASKNPASTNYRDGLHQTGKYEQQNSGTQRYPTTLLEISKGFSPNARPVHPTQKPVALFEYLIKTYTNENELVLDNTAGSGTTAIAAINTNRKWICIEKDETYANKAIERIINHADRR